MAVFEHENNAVSQTKSESVSELRAMLQGSAFIFILPSLNSKHCPRGPHTTGWETLC